MRLTWVQPEDLLGHELVQSELDGKDVAGVRSRWLAAGGSPAPPRDGASEPPAPPALRRLAVELLDELAATPAPPAGPGTAADGTAPGAPAGPALSRPARPPDRPAPPDRVTRPDRKTLADRIGGGWLGRAAGCLLGKPVEKLTRSGIREILAATGRWPLAGWFTAAGLPADVAARHPWNRRSAGTSLAENIDGMPEDDDLNFTMLALTAVERHGRDLTSDDVAALWLEAVPAGRVFTAERVAYRNLLLGFRPPDTARHHNPFREWIGARIRTDLYGWVHPGDPAAAADLARRDAAVSHVGAGVDAAALVAAAAAAAAGGADPVAALRSAVDLLEPASAVAETVRWALDLPARHPDWEAVVDEVEARYGHLHWVHALPNTAIVAAAVGHAGGDYGRAICAAVSAGWDTDSNGATVGALVGTALGAAALPGQWTRPLRNRVRTTLPGFDGIGFDVLAARTVALVPGGDG